MIVETLKIDGAVVRIYDDYIQTHEESEAIMQRVSDIILRQLNAEIKDKTA